MPKVNLKTVDWEEEGLSVVLSFKVEKNGKEAVLFTANNTTSLLYCS